MFDEPTRPETYSLLDNCKKETQTYILAQIFTENQNKRITKREVEKQLVLRCSLRDIDDNTKITKNEMISRATYVPGDIQRNLRSFYKKFNKYGLKKIEKNKSSNIELSYIWEPINMYKLENIIHPEARNIFKKDSEIDKFLDIRNHTCEMCVASKSDNKTLRLAIDHWRAHSTYNIDNTKIAVLLCERCNNIHHNHDASKIAVKFKDNLQIVKNWVKIENRIRGYGFMPNDVDTKTQKKTIETITEHYKELNPIDKDFWEGLF
jgi:hypothetical protein